MGVGKMVLMGLRALALVAALAVVALGAWSKVIIHDVETRRPAIIANLPLGSGDLGRYWISFFTGVVDSSLRVWITIVAASFAFLTSLLVLLSTLLRRLYMPASVRVPLELLSVCGMGTAFGCTLSLALSLLKFTAARLDTSGSDELAMFAMIVPISVALVITTGFGCALLIGTTITAMVHACFRPRVKEIAHYSFEPTAAALGMGQEYQAIVPPMARSRPPTMYDPGRPLPKDLEKMPETDEEKALANRTMRSGRVDSGLSEYNKNSIELEKEAAWPLSQEKPQQVVPMRPSRPWSKVPQQKTHSSIHAL